MNDSIYIGELIKSFVIYLNEIIEKNSDSQLSVILEKVRKISLKAIGYLSELYLENKNYEKSRLSIEYCFGVVKEKTVEELN